MSVRGTAAAAAVQGWGTLTDEDIQLIEQNLRQGFGSENLRTLINKVSLMCDPETKHSNVCSTLTDSLHDTVDGKKTQSSNDMGALFKESIKILLGPSVYEPEYCGITETTKSDADPFFSEAGRTNEIHRLLYREKGNNSEEINFALPRFGGTKVFSATLDFFGLTQTEALWNNHEKLKNAETVLNQDETPSSRVGSNTFRITIDNISPRLTVVEGEEDEEEVSGFAKIVHTGGETGDVVVRKFPTSTSPSFFFDQASRPVNYSCFEELLQWWELSVVRARTTTQGVATYPPFVVIKLEDVGITVLEGSTLTIELDPDSRLIRYTIKMGDFRMGGQVREYPPYVLIYQVGHDGKITCIFPPTGDTPDNTGESVARNLNVGKKTGNDWFKTYATQSTNPAFVYKGLIYVVCKLLGDDLAVLCNPDDVTISTNDKGILIRATINGVYVLYYYSTHDGVMIFRLVKPECRERIRAWREYKKAQAHQTKIHALVPRPLVASVRVNPYPIPSTTTRFGRNVYQPDIYDGTLPQSPLSSRGGNGKFPPELITLLQFFAAKLTCFNGVLKDRIDSLNKVLEVLNKIQSKYEMGLVVKCITLLQTFITSLFDLLTSVMKREDVLDFEDDVALQTRLNILLKFLLGKIKLTDIESVSLDADGNVDIDATIKTVDEILTQCTITLPDYELTERGFIVKRDFGLLDTLDNIVKYFNGVDVFEGVVDADKRDLVDILGKFKVIYAPLLIDEGDVSSVKQREQSHYQQRVYSNLIKRLKENYFKNKSLFERELTELEKNILKEHATDLPHIHDYGYTFRKFAILNVYLIPKLVSKINETLLQQGYFSLDLEESIIKALCSNESEADIVWSLFQKEFRYNGSYIARIAVIQAFISKVEFTGNRVAYAGNIDELLLINSHIDDKLLLKMEFARISLGEVIDDISKNRDSVVDATSKDAVIREINSLIKSRELGIVRGMKSGPGISSYIGHSKQKIWPPFVTVATGGRGGHKIKTRSKYVAKRRVMYKKFVSKYIIKADKRGNRGTQGGKRRGGANVTRRKILKRSRVSKNNATRKNNMIHKIHKIHKKKNTNLHYNLHKRHKTLKR